MRQAFLLPLLACAALVAQSPKPEAKADAKPSAEVKVGTAVEKMEIQGEATTFKVAAGTKIYAWTRVTGAADSTVTVVFSKGDRTSKQELKVPRSPYRTNAYRTFRTGDDGEWTVKVMAADGAELGTATFTVAFE
ncbi:MAG: hypothetical protein H6P99_2526 [Holophagaceae bacterium]|nr:hypothetical protein [Holophagaceae bacterium]